MDTVTPRKRDRPNQLPEGATLKRIRVETGISQTELAAAMGVSRRRVSGIEHEVDPAAHIVRLYVEGLESVLRLQGRL